MENEIMEDEKYKLLQQLFVDLETKETVVSLTFLEMVEIMTALQMRLRYLKKKNGNPKYQKFIKRLIKFIDFNLPL